MSTPPKDQPVDELRYKMAELMFLKLGIDMGRTDTQYPLLPPKDRDTFLDEAVKLCQAECNRARIDELELAEKSNKPAGGLHRPSYYAIDPHYAEQRLQQLMKSEGE